MAEIRFCPICQTSFEKAKLFLERNIDPVKFSNFSFASRKIPEFMCHRLLQCPICDLVYANQLPGEDELTHAYQAAHYDSSKEANDAAETYIRAIKPILKKLPKRQSVLEIGTGTGIFLEYLSHEGFTKLVGVEPSSAAIAAAPIHRQAWIREGIFKEEDFSSDSFDLICCFMTMEHVREPNIIARVALRLLRPGGAFVTVTHDYRGFINRFLGKRSPIIDIEHLQLFSRNSLRYLFQSVGYIGFDVHAIVNTYSLQYWTRLTPLPLRLKQISAELMTKIGLDHYKIGVNVGNLIAEGFKND